jgi:hypothetical protein
MKSKGYPSPLDEPNRAATVNVKAAPPSPTDTTDHNGKYFQNISEIPCDTEEKKRMIAAAKATGRFSFMVVGDKK